MAKIAIISDIHANLEALQAVFAHIDTLPGIDYIACLGDFVGYGPCPEEVIDLVEKRCKFALLGNHDHALTHMPVGFNPVAAGAIQCQRSFMEPGVFSMPIKKHRWEFLQNLKEEVWIGDEHFVHASPRDKIFEYLLPEDPTYHPDKLREVFAMVRLRCYVGHTHRPGIITEEPGFYSDKDLNGEYEWKKNEKLIVNVSSVGQPRDRDPRACYAVIEDRGIHWYRIEYDVEETVRKIRDCNCLDPMCGERLRVGR